MKPHSRSEQFPDFLFRTGKCGNRLICGSLLELNRHYPEVSGRSVNLIIKEDCGEVVGRMVRRRLRAIREFTILHKWNGEHVVFQYRF